VAYRMAAAEAISAAEIVERTVDEDVTFMFEYPLMNEVMKVVKDLEPEIVSQQFDMDCQMTLRIRKGEMGRLKERLEKIETLRITD
jgi:putative IMPACT (imprinted ancient) family translation regulator